MRWCGTLPGVLGDDASAVEDSFVNGLLDSPHYTRPEVYEGVAVPPVLMGGNHAEIVKWRRQRMLEATANKRPDLLDKARSAGLLSKADEKFLAEVRLSRLAEQDCSSAKKAGNRMFNPILYRAKRSAGKMVIGVIKWI
jgi:tRNA G37 N-methylase TrmD